MRRGTTPLHKFTLPVDAVDAGIAALYITYYQCGETTLEKSLGDAGVSIDGSSITLQLTQADTLRFIADKDVRIQIRLRTAAGDVLASNIITVTVDAILKDGVI